MVEDDGQEEEFDPLEETYKKHKKCQPFQFVKAYIAVVVTGILYSETFFSSNKFIGSNKLDLKLKKWMTMKTPYHLVSLNWSSLRFAAKLAVRYRRQLAVDWIERAYIGEIQSSWFAHTCISPLTNPSSDYEVKMYGQEDSFHSLNRSHLLRFYYDETSTNLHFKRRWDLLTDPEADSEPLTVLAWLVFTFVPCLTSVYKEILDSMLRGDPFTNYTTPSDLAFICLVLEQHVSKWKKIVGFRVNTGRWMSEEYHSKLEGLLYKDGIAGEQAKRRYNDLCLYFYVNFYSEKDWQGMKASNVANLHKRINDLVGAQVAQLEEKIVTGHTANGYPHSAQAIQDDILHRVFFKNYVA